MPARGSVLASLSARRSERMAAPRAPGPQGLELARVLAMIGRDPLEAMDHVAETYGDVALLQILGGPLYIVRGAEQVRHVLVGNQDNYVKSNAYQLMRRLLGNGLVTNEGPSWQRQRSLVAPMFTQRQLVPFAEHMAAAAAAALATWDERFKPGDPVDAAAEMTRMTLEVVGRALLGGDVAVLDAHFAAAAATANHQIGRAGRSPINVVGSRLPGMGPEQVFRLQVLRWRPHAAAVDLMDGVVEGLIDRRAAAATPAGDDLLGLLMAARDEVTGQPMSRRQIRDELMTFIAAGHDTTANGLTWMWYLLSQHPVIREQLLAEVDEVLDGGPPGADAPERLPFTRACFLEAMRLYPPVWHVQRRALHDDVLGGHPVPAGSTVLVSTWTTHRDPSVWSNPAGFDPRRFLGEAAKARPRHAYLPFGGGRRVCVGQGFAMLEAAILAAMIAQRYTLDLNPGARVVLDPTITLRPLHGLPMTVHPRRRPGEAVIAAEAAGSPRTGRSHDRR